MSEIINQDGNFKTRVLEVGDRVYATGVYLILQKDAHTGETYWVTDGFEDDTFGHHGGLVEWNPDNDEYTETWSRE